MSQQALSNGSIIINHKYYHRAYHYSASTSAAVSIDVFCYDNGVCGGSRPDSYLFSYSAKTITANQWIMSSGIFSKPTLDSGIYSYRNFFSGSSAPTVYADCHMLIDLTAIFGAGNEPDKTFMDNIEYFEGSTSVYYVN